ncbi:hypothetical protein ACLMAL_16910 [Nocardia sp. CWNU-33]|uniref:hypothetical protein n=1 Tax=Nocardia sp. CWNU-33 TaxID=3392117 RepID=UPI00398E804C
MGSFGVILYSVLIWFRWVGTIGLTIVIMFYVVSVTATSKVSLVKIVGVVGSGLVGVALFWMLPTAVNYVRSDTNVILPDHPIGSYR